MRNALTDSVVATMKPKRGQQGWIEVNDGGCRGLFLRISPRGEKVWVSRHMVSGKRKRNTIGGYPTVKLAEARKRAREYLSAARDGITAEELDAKMRASTMTVAQAHRGYLEAVASTLRVSTKARKAALFRDYIQPVIGTRLVRSIRRGDVVEVAERAKKQFRVQANRVFSELMALLRWCEQKGYIDGVPAVRRRDVGSREQPRRRTLTPQEIGELWRATNDLRDSMRDFIRLLLLTGQRRSEVREIEWDEIDLAQRLWTIPAKRYKTNIDHAVPLSTLAVDILQARHTDGITGYVLVGRLGATKAFNNAEDAIAQVREKMPSRAPFVLHDLRRTVRTGLARLGVDDETAEMVIGHLPQGIRKVYDVHDRLEERRSALEKWAEFVLRTANDQAA
ncbi:MAG TPA: tyrosine-type recombinase/integrase, partial [Alphaproteobacteria bacterium]